MTDPPQPPSPDAAATGAVDLEDWALSAFYCPRCEADIARLPAARFCPRCGAALRPAAVPAILIDVPTAPDEAAAAEQPTAEAGPPADPPSRTESGRAETLLGEWQRLQRSGALQEPVSITSSANRLDGPRSPIVTGYANALCRLGWRYESHLGFERNVSEAVRCYLKAARLGNEEALAKLTGMSDR